MDEFTQAIAAQAMVARLKELGFFSGLTKAAEARDAMIEALAKRIQEHYPELLSKIAARLSYQERKEIPKSEFAIPEKAPGPGSYPMPDEAHARNAWARVNAFGTPEEKAKVLRAIKNKYPGLYSRIMAKKADSGEDEEENEEEMTPAEKARQELLKRMAAMRAARNRNTQPGSPEETNPAGKVNYDLLRRMAREKAERVAAAREELLRRMAAMRAAKGKGTKKETE